MQAINLDNPLQCDTAKVSMYVIEFGRLRSSHKQYIVEERCRSISWMVGQRVWNMYEWRMWMGEDFRGGERGEGMGIMVIQKDVTQRWASKGTR